MPGWDVGDRQLGPLGIEAKKDIRRYTSHAMQYPDLVAALMILVGLIGGAGPVRAGLRAQPTDALKER
jgi:hypothetical protein